MLGLGGLRISSDCSDGESDRELPSSATESDGSPVPSSQPAFPVQILPYLYLGCAKDSTNLDVLGKYGIKYILNVTPNLPNAFEHGGEFTYKQIPISDHWSQNLSQFFPEAISFIGRCRYALGGVGGQVRRGVYGTWVSLAPDWVPRGLSEPVCALHVPACTRGRTHACCESPGPSGPEQSPESWIPPPPNCWHPMDSTVQLVFFWLCCFGLSKLKHHSSQTSHRSYLLCITPQHTCFPGGGCTVPLWTLFCT